MGLTGRYIARLPNGRTFIVEPIEDRVRTDAGWGWYEGLDPARGGAVRPEESRITPERCKNIQVVGNPMDVIERAMRDDGLL
jgi:hypothetical protein